MTDSTAGDADSQPFLHPHKTYTDEPFDSYTGQDVTAYKSLAQIARSGKQKSAKSPQIETGFETYHEFSKSSAAVFYSFLGLILYFGLGAVAYSVIFNRLTVLDAIYFTVVTCTTCGYGDLSPEGPVEILFTIFFILLGVLVLATIALEILFDNIFDAYDKILEKAKAKSQNRFMNKFDVKAETTNLGDPLVKRRSLALIVSATSSAKEENSRKHLQNGRSSMWKDMGKEMVNMTPLIMLLILGALIIGRLEGWDTMESIYFMVVTATTVGYGDFSPERGESKMFCILFIPIAIGVMAQAFGGLTGVYLGYKRERCEAEFLNRRLTAADIERMDYDKDGSVSNQEFTRFMLVSMGKVTHEDLDKLQALFEKLDRVKDGSLDVDDLNDTK